MNTAQRLFEAFTSNPLTKTERALLQVLLDNPGRTSTELSELIGWRGNAWHLHFGTMCKRREASLWPAERFESTEGYFYSGIVSDVERDDAGNWRYTIKPDLVEAFAELGLKPARRA